MKRLIIKIILFCSILLIIKLFTSIGDTSEYSYRRAGFAAHRFNTVFVGSSRTKHSIIPAYFDVLNGGETDSYNFGINFALPPKTFDECENLIRQSSSLKYIFFELSGESSEYDSGESSENYSLRNYLKNEKDLSVEELSLSPDSFVLKIFQPRITITFTDYNLSYQEVIERGEMSIKKTPSPKAVALLRQLNLQVEQETADRNFTLRDNYRNRISRLTELAESKNVKIYFFVPPRLMNDLELETVLPIYRSLDKKYKLAVPHYDEFFYQPDTSLDDLHLNTAGAQVFTEKISEAFKNHGR